MINANKILNNFPGIELSYEKNLYNKVLSAELYITIPKGRKYFAWFHYYKNNPICYLLCLNRNRSSFDKIEISSCCFDKLLSCGKGTILYGTIFNLNNKRFFNVEDIYYFKNKNISGYTQSHKLKFFKSLFANYIKQISYSDNDVIFGLPMMSYNKTELINSLKAIPYDVYCIQGRKLNSLSPYYNKRITIKKELFATFLIKPDIDFDIYHLYCINNIDEYIKYDTAYINSFNTSVFMNSLFRNIKENRNLDLLEESDDEDDFEDVRPEKYVYLEKSFLIKCKYSYKFKMWIPIEPSNDDVIRYDQINNSVIKKNK
jgi:hypothetical protein